jgi:Tfp pilus assembly ATPase PilU
MVKGYNLTIDYALYEMSYANMIMYSSVLQSSDSKEEVKMELNRDEINADNPANKELVQNILFG